MSRKNIDELNRIVIREIYPQVARDFFTKSPFLSFLKSKGYSVSNNPQFKFGFTGFKPAVGDVVEELELEIDEDLMKEYEEYLEANE